MKQNFGLFFLSGAMVLVANSAGATSIYDNNISALNINMLSDVFMSYTSHGEKMSDLFSKRDIYGTMGRLDEYGDDGSTLKTFEAPDAPAQSVLNTVWINANHINEHLHYGQNISEHGRFNLATIGGTTQTIDLAYGKISFGGFASYIYTKLSDFHGGGDVVGLFANYKYQNFGVKALADIGSLNNSSNGMDFNNSWVNVAADINAVFKIDPTFLFKPNVSVAHTYVSSDDLFVDGNMVSSKDYDFFNIAPGAAFIKEISPNWYGSLSAKYVTHFGGKNDINVGGVKTKGLYLDNHTDIGIDVEHNFKHLIFGANVHKQLGDLDGWSSNINVKYAF